MSSIKAINKFTSFFGVSVVKLGVNECDYKIINSENKIPLGYAQVEIVKAPVRAAYPLMISGTRVSQLLIRFLNPTVIWACDDGIIYGKMKQLYGNFRWYKDDMYLFLNKQKKLKFIKYYEE